MNFINPSGIGTKVILLIPIIICLSLSVAIAKTDGNIIAGFNMLSEAKKTELRKRGYIKKTQRMIYAMLIPLLISFILSFVIKSNEIFNNVLISMWMLFAIIVILGIIIINLSVKK